MAAHALGEGCAVGVSFCGDRGWAQARRRGPPLLLLLTLGGAEVAGAAAAAVATSPTLCARPRPPPPQGLLTTLAIGVHNVPEGLAKATVLVGQGVSARRALVWSIVTCLPQPLVAVPSFIFVEAFTVRSPGAAACC